MLKTIEVKIRNVPEDLALQLSEQAERKGMTRAEYLRRCLESIAVIGDLKEVEERYASLVKMSNATINMFTDEVRGLKEAVELIGEILTDGLEEPDGYTDS